MEGTGSGSRSLRPPKNTDPEHTALFVHTPDGIPGDGEDEEGEGTPERQQGAPEKRLHRHTVQAFMLKGQ